jgi:hypothetical protein
LALATTPTKQVGDAIIAGSEALGVLVAAFPKESMPELFNLLELLLDYPSQMTALIAGCVLDHAGQH